MSDKSEDYNSEDIMEEGEESMEMDQDDILARADQDDDDDLPSELESASDDDGKLGYGEEGEFEVDEDDLQQKDQENKL